ncbi:hypothetical protein C8F01DRAFT_1077162 [Mycena amicta]|nr:hypothetical protein C8F01DRAFT_1077162 [Mycena amicta]
MDSDTGYPTEGHKRKRSRSPEHNKRRWKKEKEKTKAEKQQKWVNWENHVKTGISLLRRIPVHQIFLYKLQRDHRRLDKLQALEQKLGCPLTRELVDEHFPDWVWISRQGLHYGYIERSQGQDPLIVLGAHVNSWLDMQPESRETLFSLLNDLNMWSDLNYKIKNNAAAKHPAKQKKPAQPAKAASVHTVDESDLSDLTDIDSDSDTADPPMPLPFSDVDLSDVPESEDEVDAGWEYDSDPDRPILAKPHAAAKAPPFKPLGAMTAVGWHLSQEKNKTLVSYAFANKDKESLAIVEELITRLPDLSALYRDRLIAIFAGAADKLQEFADKNGVLSFAETLDGANPQRPYTNSLTVTKCGFGNFQHLDADAIDIAFGLWWEAIRIRDRDGKLRWKCSEDVDHNKTKGGEFIWGEYGIGVDFPNCKGLVEIYWRGKVDFHGTMKSEDEPGHTRFGSSVQITKKGVDAMHKVFDTRELAASLHDVEKLAANKSTQKRR